MKDKLLEAMKSPHCLAGIVPDNGGMWVAPCRPNRPRNFATNPATWNAFGEAYNGIGTRDFQFDLNVVFKEFPATAKPVFYDASLGSFGLRISSDSTSNFYFHFKNLVDGLNFNYVSASKASSAPWYNAPQLKIGKNHFRITRTGATLEITVNDYTFSATGTAILSPKIEFAQSMRSSYGSIEHASLSIQGAVAWEAAHSELYETDNPYPSVNRDDVTPGLSEAERVRLLTNTNVRTDRGCFESAGGTAGFYVKTPLKLRDIASFTVIARATLEEISGTYAWIFNLDENNFSGAYTGRGGLVFNLSTVLSTTATKYVQIPLSGLTGHEHAYAFQLDGATMRLFVDGVLRGELVLPDATRVAGEEMPLFVGSPNAFTQPFLSRVSALAVFDYAMSAAEIKALN